MISWRSYTRRGLWTILDVMDGRKIARIRRSSGQGEHAERAGGGTNMHKCPVMSDRSHLGLLMRALCAQEPICSMKFDVDGRYDRKYGVFGLLIGVIDGDHE